MTDYERLSLVAMNLEGPADSWFIDYVEDRSNLTWEKFAQLVLDRFLNPTGGGLTTQFNKLR